MNNVLLLTPVDHSFPLSVGMSLGLLKTPNPASCFPCVSGDEPPHRPSEGVGIGLFSRMTEPIPLRKALAFLDLPAVSCSATHKQMKEKVRT